MRRLRLTICDVYLRSGHGYGLLIEPCSDDEIRAYVTDFAEHILKGNTIESEEDEEKEEEAQGIAQEIARAVRNPAGLIVAARWFASLSFKGFRHSASAGRISPPASSLLPGATALTRTGLSPARTIRLSGRTIAPIIRPKATGDFVASPR